MLRKSLEKELGVKLDDRKALIRQQARARRRQRRCVLVQPQLLQLRPVHAVVA